ncbi:MAG: hypothetical protein ABW168_27645 [Sedimenticola sp.]
MGILAECNTPLKGKSHSKAEKPPTNNDAATLYLIHIKSTDAANPNPITLNGKDITVLCEGPDTRTDCAPQVAPTPAEALYLLQQHGYSEAEFDWQTILW